MAQSRGRTDLHARLVWIELPGLRVKGHRLALDAVDAIDTPFGPRVRELPEVSAPPDRQIDATEPDRRSGNFHERPTGAVEHVWMARRVGNAVPIVVAWKNSLVVDAAFFADDVERPEA